MPYPPSKKRQNLIYSACHRWVKKQHPAVYALIRKAAMEEIPVARAGRHAVVTQPQPEPIVKFKINPRLRTLRPMKKRGEVRV